MSNDKEYGAVISSSFDSLTPRPTKCEKHGLWCGPERCWEPGLTYHNRRTCDGNVPRLSLRGTRQSVELTIQDSSVRLDQIRVVPVEPRIHSVAGSLDDTTLGEINDALKLSLGLD
jgi:hypothetical protein